MSIRLFYNPPMSQKSTTIGLPGGGLSDAIRALAYVQADVSAGRSRSVETRSGPLATDVLARYQACFAYARSLEAPAVSNAC